MILKIIDKNIRSTYGYKLPGTEINYGNPLKERVCRKTNRKRKMLLGLETVPAGRTLWVTERYAYSPNQVLLNHPGKSQPIWSTNVHYHFHKSPGRNYKVSQPRMGACYCWLYLTLKIKAVSSSETSGYFRNTRRYNPGECAFYSHRRENIRSKTDRRRRRAAQIYQPCTEELHIP
jgi:hypothetical protein